MDDSKDVIIEVVLPESHLAPVSFSAPIHIDAATETTNAPARVFDGKGLTQATVCLPPFATVALKNGCF